MTTLHLRTSIGRSPLRFGLPRVQSIRIIRGFFLIPVALACFALSPTARAACQKGCDLSAGNTFLGDSALVNNTAGIQNTAIGLDVLSSNTTGENNTATGEVALSGNMTGSFNTANGAAALRDNNGDDNTATGVLALQFNTSGSFNTATAFQALNFNTTGNYNTATGFEAMRNNTTGSDNTATGRAALSGNTTGSTNIALGFTAGQNLTTGDNNVDIGNVGVAAESNTIRIGTQGTQTRTFIAGIYPVCITGVPVGVNASGQLGIHCSSARCKEAIKPMDKASEAIFSLQPVTFRYKKALDPEALPQFGLVAEQVAKVDPDLVARDADGKPFTVRYDEVNVMLLNEFLKEHRTVEQLKKDFESKLAEQQRQIKALTSGLEKVSAQLEASRPVAQLVNNSD
jgi:hypothetical protein